MVKIYGLSVETTHVLTCLLETVRELRPQEHTLASLTSLLPFLVEQEVKREGGEGWREGGEEGGKDEGREERKGEGGEEGGKDGGREGGREERN